MAPMKAIPVHAFNPGPLTGRGNTTWLLPGHVPTLIDAGTGEPRHLEALERALDGARLAQVLVTHSHVDHASGAPAIAERMPHVRFLKMPWPDHDASWHVRWEPLKDGESIAAGDSVLTAVHTPGHSPDHLCLWDAGDRQLFCGDLAWKGSTVVIPPSHGGDVAEYLASLERVIQLGPDVMLPAHGDVIDKPIELLREQQVINALRSGISDPAEMVTRIYPSLAAPLVPIARESVIAHLLKLEREGRARRHGDAWNMIEP